MVGMRALLWTVMIASFGCGSDTPSQDSGMPMLTPLVGDWFLCNAADCSTLLNHGARWDADGTWVMLEVRDAQALEPTGMYCSNPHDAGKGPYTFDVTTGALVMTDDLGRDAGGGTVMFADPMASLTSSTGAVSMYLRIDPPRLSGPCPITL